MLEDQRHVQGVAVDSPRPREHTRHLRHSGLKGLSLPRMIPCVRGRKTNDGLVSEEKLNGFALASLASSHLMRRFWAVFLESCSTTVVNAEQLAHPPACHHLRGISPGLALSDGQLYQALSACWEFMSAMNPFIDIVQGAYFLMPFCLPIWKSGMVHSAFVDWHLLHLRSAGLRWHLTLLRRHARQAACLGLPAALLLSEGAEVASIRTLRVV